jgi:uncharacterized metal-binding protein YceD (DUF177 family)
MSGFDLKLKIDGIRSGDRIDLTADAAAREQIAERLGLSGLERLDAHAILERDGEEIRAAGRLRASLEQPCVITGDPVAARIDEPFELLFRAEPEIAPDEEIELSQDDCDVVFHDGATIDLGAAIADTLALAIDPYPRSAGADAALKEAGILSEAEAGPFAALAKLKRD